MWATIIIAESFTRIMGSTAGNVYSTRTVVVVVSYSITLWILVGGQNFIRGAGPFPPAGAGAAVSCLSICSTE